MKIRNAVSALNKTWKNKILKQDFIWIPVVILIAASLFIICSFLPDERPDAIRKELKKQGYKVDNIEFMYVMDGNGYKEWIYESSEPIDYDGYSIRQWSLFSYRFTSFFTHYFVMPYPPLPEPVHITISFTAEEYKRISESANGQSIEEFIQQTVSTSLQ